MRIYILAFTTISLISCGGGGGGGSAPAPVPQNITVSLTSSADSAEVNSSITLTWSSTLATSCSASGAWSGSKGTSGTESISIGIGGSNTFSLSCSATGANSGSASTTVNGLRYFDGKVFDGYIRGAEVFVDANDNLTLDANEASVTTDNQGSFTKLLFGNGTLVSKGGFDLDTGVDLTNLTLVHKLVGFEESKLASPFTTLIAYMSDASIINAALGIDASIDLLTTDPIPNLGEGIYDQMYEKGNQLTVLSYTLQNQAAADSSQLYFEAIADQLDESYAANQAAVDIEDPTFISNVIDKAETASATTLSPDVKANLNAMLSTTIPLLKVYADSNTTASVQRFTFSTLQNDVQDSAVIDSSTSTKIAQYNNNVFEYVATDQGIDEATINPTYNNAPTISSSATFSIAENQIGFGSVTATDSDGDTLTYSISGSEINISSSGVLTFASAPDYETKNSYSATVTVSDGTDSVAQNITVNVIDVDEAIPNQAPSISSSASFSAAENQTAIGSVTATDSDGDTLTYSISGSEINISSSGVLTFASAPDYETKNSYSATVTVSDGTLPTTQDITVSITNVNEAPVFSSSVTFSANENQTSIGSVSASDADGDSLTYSISGSEINISSSGVLTFASAPDYETKNSYTATVTVSDGTNSATQGITVNIGDINLPASQIGSNIIGEANNGNCYKCILRGDKSHDIDNDGDTILIGRNGSWGVSGWATVYQKNGSSWSEMSSTKLAGAASGNGFGANLEIDADGLVLIGSGQQQNIGYVFPLEYVSGTWIRNPDYGDYGPIYYSGSGDGSMGLKDISLSSNGNVMSYIYEKTGGNPNFTKLFVHDDQGSPNYTFNGNNQTRAIITISTSTAYHKKHVLNSDGSYIAAAQNNGNIIVYEWDGTNYAQKGDLISSCSGLSGYSQLGLSGLVISNDGQKVAMHTSNPSGGSPGAVCVYSWSGSAWTQQGDTIVGSNNSDSLSSIAISGDGNRLALGSSGFDNDNSNIGQVTVYDWSISTNNWKQSGANILGEAANSDFGSLSLSGDGRTIVISSTPSSGNFGQIQVFDLPVN